MHYTRTAVALHWLLAAAIVGSLCVGLYMTSLPFSPQRLKLYNWHKWAGVFKLIECTEPSQKTVVRVVWIVPKILPQVPTLPCG